MEKHDLLRQYVATAALAWSSLSATTQREVWRKTDPFILNVGCVTRKEAP